MCFMAVSTQQLDSFSVFCYNCCHLSAQKEISGYEHTSKCTACFLSVPHQCEQSLRSYLIKKMKEVDDRFGHRWTEMFQLIGNEVQTRKKYLWSMRYRKKTADYITWRVKNRGLGWLWYKNLSLWMAVVVFHINFPLNFISATPSSFTQVSLNKLIMSSISFR